MSRKARRGVQELSLIKIALPCVILKLKDRPEDTIMVDALTPTKTVLDEITDFLATNPTPEEILAYRLPAALEARAHELLERNGEGELLDEETQELHAFMQAEQMMSLLKAKTRLKLKNRSK
jgi:hypothetical protein